MQATQQASAGLGNVALAYSVAGTGNRLDANPVDAGENTGRLSITLQKGARRADEETAMDGMRTSLDDLPGVQYRFSRPALFSMSTPLEVVVSGYDLDRLQAAAEQVRAKMLADPRFADVKTTVEAGNPEIQIVFDQERAAQLGLVVRDIADRLVNSVRGDVATRYKLRDKQIDVLVRSVDNRAASIEEVRNLIVNPGAEHPVTLSAVADVRLAVGPAEVRRIGQERVAVVSANLAEGDLGSAIAALQQIVASSQLPVGTVAFLSGQSEEMTDSFRSLQFVLLLAIFLVYLVMASQFESLIHPFVILLTIPLAVIGAVWALVAHQHDAERRGLHRPDHAGGHRRQPVDRADRRREPGARARHDEARGHRRGGAAAPATDPDHQADDDPRPDADGARPRRRRRGARADGDHGHRRRAAHDVPDAARDPGRLLGARPQGLPGP